MNNFKYFWLFDNYVLLKVLGDVMITLKFGGTSMGNARRIIDSATIMKERAEKDRISVVVLILFLYCKLFEYIVVL